FIAIFTTKSLNFTLCKATFFYEKTATIFATGSVGWAKNLRIFIHTPQMMNLRGYYSISRPTFLQLCLIFQRKIIKNKDILFFNFNPL
ncbi:hypothetical protein, partial [Campylobacter sp.]|uniref:hypothetical protein n=1 Tax=Campylobacter sp. TaxID=205 RepID=UPI002AA77604